METREIAESDALSAWFAAAAPCPDTAARLWQENPHLPRCLRCGITFDVVFAERRLLKPAYGLLARYDQPLGPAVLFTKVSSAAVLVPRGTSERWNGLMANVRWPARLPRPRCVGSDNVLLIPAPRPSGLRVRWLVAPDEEQAIGGAPLLTSSAPLARCLTEACALLASARRPAPRTPLRRAASLVRSVLPSPQRT
jgi:hypothetical protein